MWATSKACRMDNARGSTSMAANQKPCSLASPVPASGRLKVPVILESIKSTGPSIDRSTWARPPDAARYRAGTWQRLHPAPAIADIGLLKGVKRAIRHRRQIGQISGFDHHIQVYHLMPCTTAEPIPPPMTSNFISFPSKVNGPLKLVSSGTASSFSLSSGALVSGHGKPISG